MVIRHVNLLICLLMGACGCGQVVKFHTAAYRLPGDVILSDDAEGSGAQSPDKPRVLACRLASGANRRTPLVALLYPASNEAVERLEGQRQRHANLHHPALQQYMGRVVQGDGEESGGLLMEAPPKLTLAQHLEQQASRLRGKGKGRRSRLKQVVRRRGNVRVG